MKTKLEPREFIREATMSGQVAGYNKMMEPAIRRTVPSNKTNCEACVALEKLGSTNVTCGICGRKN